MRLLQVWPIHVGYSFLMFNAIHVGTSQHQFTIESWDFIAGRVDHNPRSNRGIFLSMAPLTPVKAAMLPDIPHQLQQLMMKNRANLEKTNLWEYLLWVRDAKK